MINLGYYYRDLQLQKLNKETVLNAKSLIGKSLVDYDVFNDLIELLLKDDSRLGDLKKMCEYHGYNYDEWLIKSTRITELPFNGYTIILPSCVIGFTDIQNNRLYYKMWCKGVELLFKKNKK